MDPAAVRSLYRYDEWANARLIDAVAELPEERRRAPIESSFPSLLETVGHIVSAEWIWLERWRGESPSLVPGWVDHPVFEDVCARLRVVERERHAFLASLTAEDLETTIAYRLMSGAPHEDRLLDLLLHVVNHSSYHRGQLVTMLRQVGGRTVSTDYVVFLHEQGSAAPESVG